MLFSLRSTALLLPAWGVDMGRCWVISGAAWGENAPVAGALLTWQEDVWGGDALAAGALQTRRAAALLAPHGGHGPGVLAPVTML